MGSQSIPPLSLSGDQSSSETSPTREIAHGESFRCETTIDVLPDDVLLEIFDFYRRKVLFNWPRFVWKWHRLLHICRRWRQIVFESPHRLHLEILCTETTPVRERLLIWPALPIVITFNRFQRTLGPEGVDNVIAALQHPDRVCRVSLKVTHSELEKMFAVMQVPFPVLTCLENFPVIKNAPVFPARFLGSSAPHLKEISLYRIPFPALPTLLLSTSNLVRLTLSSVPSIGYISPEAMAVGLAPLTRLERLIIQFQSVTLHPDQLHPPPPARIVLPSLTYFAFRGACEYMENLVARIDSHHLDRIHVDYSNQLFDLPVAQLTKFLDRSMGPNLTLLRHARVIFYSNLFSFSVHRHPWPDWHIACHGVGPQVSNIAQSFRQFSTTLSNVVYLKLGTEPEDSEGRQLEDTDVEWFYLLRQFSTVRLLYVSQDLAGLIALALEDINVEMVAKVLPSLDSIYLAGQPASSVKKFVAARRLCGYPVTVVATKTLFYKRLESSIGE